MPPHDNADPPAVRPLGPDGPDSRDRIPGSVLALIVGVAGLVIGFVMGGVAAESPEATGAGNSATTSSTEPRYLVSGAAPTSTSVTTTPPPPTTTTTRGPIAPDPTLGEMVPGFEFVLTYSLGDPDGRLGRWSSRSNRPAEVELPPGAAGARFDTSGRWVATDTFSTLGNALYLGTAGNLRPAFIGAESFAWHDRAPEAIAFLSGSPADGDPIDLYAGIISNIGFEYERVATIDEGFAHPPILSWGDWGFALLGRGPNGALKLTTLAPDGAEVATRQDVVLVDARPDGTLLIVELYDQPGPETGRNYAFLYTDPTLSSDRPAPEGLDGQPKWSHSGEFLANMNSAGFAPAVAVHSDTDTFEILLDVDDAFVFGWTPDDRFIIAWTPRTLTRSGFGPALLFVDLVDRSVNAVPIDGVVTAIGFEL